MTSDRARGTAAALLSNLMFAVLYMFGEWMKPVTGTAVFAWRMVSMFAVLWLWMSLTHRREPVFADIARLLRKRRNLPVIPLTTAIVGSQMWLFMWAPVNGHGLDVAVGYFLYPLVLIAVGRFFFRESMNRAQTLAVVCAVIGVSIQILHKHSFSWVTAWTAGTFPVYFIIRRKMNISALSGLLMDLTLIFPFALAWLWMSDWGIPAPDRRLWILIPLLGILSAAAMQFNLFAAFRLPVPLYGIFSYLEPTLLFVIAVVVFDVSVDTADLFCYIFIGMGIALMMHHNLRVLRRGRHLKKIRLGQHPVGH